MYCQVVWWLCAIDKWFSIFRLPNDHASPQPPDIIFMDSPINVKFLQKSYLTKQGGRAVIFLKKFDKKNSML